MSRDFNVRIARLIIKHKRDLYAYILACVRNHHDAEEVFQEVSVGIVSSFDKLRSCDEFLPWAIEIARRQVFSFYRRSARPMIYDSELVDVMAEAANRLKDSPEGTDRSQALRECLDRLPPRSQEVLRMRYCDSFSGVEQIAGYLGRTMSATYGVLKRIRVTVLRCVEERISQGLSK